MTRPCTHKSRLVSSGWSPPLSPKADILIAGMMSAMCQKRIGLVRTLQTKLQTNCASRPGTGQHRTR